MRRGLTCLALPEASICPAISTDEACTAVSQAWQLPALPGGVQEGDWPLSMLQKYIAWAKGRPAPTISPQAEAVLEWYYRCRRRAAVRSAAQTTVRLLQSLVRLAQVGPRLASQLWNIQLAIWSGDEMSLSGVIIGPSGPCRGRRSALAVTASCSSYSSCMVVCRLTPF